MIAILGLLVMAALVAVISTGTAYALDNVKRDWSAKKRAVVSAICGGFFPALLPLFAVVSTGNSDIPGWIPIAAICVMAVTFGGLIGFPSAFVISNKLEEKRGGPISADTFE
ncbi:hypothetical protein ACRAQ6_11615 [Erythrobacter sp. HA6-11]